MPGKKETSVFLKFSNLKLKIAIKHFSTVLPICGPFSKREKFTTILGTVPGTEKFCVFDSADHFFEYQDCFETFFFSSHYFLWNRVWHSARKQETWNSWLLVSISELNLARKHFPNALSDSLPVRILGTVPGTGEIGFSVPATHSSFN